MENKIEIHNMNLHYGDFHALHDINLDIKENEITAFIGPHARHQEPCAA